MISVFLEIEIGQVLENQRLRFAGRLMTLILLTYLLSVQSSYARQGESSFLYLRDQAGLLNVEEQARLETKLADYRTGSNHAIFVHITDRKFSDEEARKFGEANFKTYQSRAGDVNSTTLIYIDLYRYMDSEKFSSTPLVFYDWDELASNAVDQNDHYYSRVPRNNNLISYRFELKVLFNYFMDEDYIGGLERCVDLIEQIHLGKIKSTDIGPTFIDSAIGTFVFYFLIFFVLMVVLVIIGRKRGWKGGTFTSSSISNNTYSSTNNSSSTYDDGDYSSGSSSSSGGSHGGGESGGGGSSSDW